MVKMFQKTISIIIPVYNGEKRIRYCIDSIINQKVPNVEIIVVNDGSTDKTAQILASYSSRYKGLVKVFSQENKGVSSARNKGIELALGNWIMFVDVDDYLEPNTLKRIIEYKKLNDFDLIIAGFYLKDEVRDTSKYKIQEFHDRKDIGNLLIQDQWTQHIPLKVPSGKLFKTELIKKLKLKFNENFSIAEDTMFVTEYYMHIQNLVYFCGPFYVYWRSVNSLSTIGIADLVELTKARMEVLKIQKKFAQYYLDESVDTYMKENIIDDYKTIVLNAAKGNKKVKDINESLNLFFNDVNVKKYARMPSKETFLEKVILKIIKLRLYMLVKIMIKLVKIMY
ncbi:glycosyltransferase family 2 protein [Ligilactobacillus salivarius]|nr:glycosyltransferase family 2 protein [Ligilactobacillus salivarius]WHS05442.1 glycosyltransferase family 2 protein [Ligilactobacillus salivarius]WHS08482.1 glycosyltransferase family 2 protein [Ligilactobacillus salivarius]WHS13295.1 glycosyltransferase family 2 protein [Ligilactobacillus salivarius]WHS19562.1 glycosyltransferase family 2 protein [Ligilactobacillus salivarius]WHS21715.1 glycosyltransferase family 2 protein [Ligilactobacillus salivarius]